MKFMNHWPQLLSLGLVLSISTSFVNAQEMGYPIPMHAPVDSGMIPANPTAGMSFCSGDMGCPDSSCDGLGCEGGATGMCACGGAMCGGTGACLGAGIGNRFGQGCGYRSGGLGLGNECGPNCNGGGCGPLSRFKGSGGPLGRLGNGCGPLGCNGGTFGDGRSLSQLFSSIFSSFAGFGLGVLTPYGEGGVAAQRWFDLSAEAVWLRREKGAGNFNFSSLGKESGIFVLDSNDVDLDQYRAGLGLQGNVQVGPGSNVELVYFGLNEWEQSAAANATVVTATDGNLYSFFSNFGDDPDDGFDDSDRSVQHRVNYKSALNNGELNLRRRWAEPSGFLQGSFLAGIRHIHLTDTLGFSATGQNNNTVNANQLRFFDYTTKARNQLTGFQIGSDLWLNLIPGVKLGGELKAGVFGNHSTQDTRIFANSIPFGPVPEIRERASDGKCAWLVQASTQAVYRLTYAWAVRGSYQLIYIDNVALAPENFNSVPPGFTITNAARPVRVNNDGEILYTGFTLGAEYTW
jgi:hypothetical protein